MHFLEQISISTFLLALATFSRAQQPGEIYYLTNCFNSMSQTSYAEIDFYTNTSLSAIAGKASQPDLLAFINLSSSVDYEDGPWSSLSGSPFNFTAVIENDAYTTNAGTVVGKANCSLFSGSMECMRLARLVVHTQKEVTCYSDYACLNSAK